MRIMWLIPLALPLMAASPPRQLSLTVPPAAPAPSFSLGNAARPPAYAPAPLPNRDLNVPRQLTSPSQTTLSPTLFTQRDRYRGDGFSTGSSPQNEQERRLRPGAGFSLRMPLQPQ